MSSRVNDEMWEPTSDTGASSSLSDSEDAQQQRERRRRHEFSRVRKIRKEFPDYPDPGVNPPRSPKLNVFTEFEWTPDKRRKIITSCREIVQKEKLLLSMRQCNRASSQTVEQPFESLLLSIVEQFL